MAAHSSSDACARKQSAQLSRRLQTPEIVVYQKPPKKKKDNIREVVASSSSSSSKNSSPPVFNLEKARAEVRQFGIQGFKGRSKTEAEIAKLRDLGAEIPKVWVRKMERKKKNLNYQRHKQDLRIGVKTKIKKNPEENEKKSSKKDVKLKPTIGKLSGGVHFLKEADIKQVLNSK